MNDPPPIRARSGSPPPSEQSKSDFESRIADLVDEFTDAMHRGERPDVEEFARRQPALAPAIREVLGTLQAVCDSNATVAAREAVGFETLLGKPLGDYAIVREIGRGGMGVVYEAEQLSLKRRVALKVLPFAAVLDSKQLERFKNEALAAAHLRHPNIVAVLSVGCERGIHYYAMELIDGRSLAEVITELRPPGGSDEEQVVPNGVVEDRRSPTAEPCHGLASATKPAAALTTDGSTRHLTFFRAAARLGAQAARALDFAHERGVIHRDIKPANLMVDSRGDVWVTDFGLAQISDSSRITLTGDMLGTLRYMSPEQALAKRTVVDHRSDVYSLGVTLYELLTLEPAFPGRDRQEVLRRIAFDEPTAPHRINPATPVELATIVLKAMAKNPDERYGTAAELADDLDRYVRDEPIRARRPTLFERSIKWSRRHQPVVWSAGVSAALLLVAAVVGLAVSNVLITRETNEKDAALREKDRAIEEREMALATTKVHQEAAEAHFALARRAVDELYMELADELNNVPHMQGVRRKFLLEAIEFYKQFAEQKRLDPARRFATAQAYLRVGSIHQTFAHHGEAKEAIDHAQSLLEELVEEFPEEAAYRAELGLAYTMLGSTHVAMGQFRQGCTLYRGAVGLLENVTGDAQAAPSHRARLSAAYGSLGTTQGVQIEEAERVLGEAIRIGQSLVAEFNDHHEHRTNLMTNYYNLGAVLAASQRFADAENSYRQALDLDEDLAAPPESAGRRLIVACAHRELGTVLFATGRIDDARFECEQSIRILEQQVTDFPDVVGYQSQLAAGYTALGSQLVRAGHSSEAEAHWLKAANLFENLCRQLPDELTYTVNLVMLHNDLSAYVYDRRPREKRESWKRITEIMETPAGRAALADSSNELIQSYMACAYARGLAVLNRPHDAEAACQKAIELNEQLDARMPDEPIGTGPKWRLAMLHHLMGGLAQSDARPHDAAKSYRKALELYGASALFNNDLAWLLVTYPDQSIHDAAQAVALAKRALEIQPSAANVWNTLGVAQYRAGDYRGAIESLEWSESLTPGSDLGENGFFLAMAHWQLGEHETARSWFERAAEWTDKNQPKNDELRRFRAEAVDLMK